MKHFPRALLSLFVAIPVFAQAPQFAASSEYTFNMQRSPRAGARLVPDSKDAATKNTQNWNTIVDNVHLGVGGIRDDLYLPAGRWYHDGTLRIGINAAQTQIRAGGSIRGAGGFGNQMFNNAINISLGAETRLINTSTDDANRDGFSDGASLLYGGFGWHIGRFAIWGFDLQSQPDWKVRNEAQKQEVGLRVQASAIPGPANGSYLWVQPISFMGFKDAILFQPKSGTSSQANNTYWTYIAADTCDTVFHVNDGQSMVHEIYALTPGEHCRRGIFMERGGQIHVYSMQVLVPDFLVAEIGDKYHTNYGDLVIDGLKLDNFAQSGVTLLKLGKQLPGQPRAVRITGSVGRLVGFDPAGACQGIQPDDKIFINFTGDPANSALLNAFSTVDASGNYLKQPIGGNQPKAK